MDRPVSELKPHPLNATLYGDTADADLLESVRRHGILTPLVVSADGVVISGHRRLNAAILAGIERVPVTLFGSGDRLDITEALIECNRQRVKPPSVVAREAETLREVESERARLRMAEAGTRAAPGKPSEKGLLLGANLSQTWTHEAVAERLGITPATARRAMEVGKELKRLEQSNEPADQDRAKELLNVVDTRGFRPAATFVKTGTTSGGGSLLVKEQERTSRATFNRTNSNVDWAWWTWNPVTGCLHGCPYCYAREIANRFYPQKFEPTFHPDRLTAPLNTVLPKSDDPRSRRVFTCSMADLFGKWVPDEWISAVFDQVRDNPQWEFLFLTKFPQRLAELDWPANAWVGASVDRQHRVSLTERAFAGVKAGVRWLSIEPMLEPIQFTDMSMFDWVVIGAQSDTNQPDGTHVPAFTPELAWVTALLKQAAAAGCKVFIKDNLLPLVRQEPRARR